MTSVLKQVLFGGVTLFSLSGLSACSQQVEIFGDDGGGSGGCSDDRPLTAPSECGGDWTCEDGRWVFQPRDCPPECPQEPPFQLSCTAEMEGRGCDYFTFACDGGGPSLAFECSEGRWEEVPTGCQACPPEAPVVGTDCTAWPEASFCDYTATTTCGPTSVSLACQATPEGPHWISFGGAGGACGEGCGGYLDEVGCAADDGCRWLVPGCAAGDNPLSAAGCFAMAPCTKGSCAMGQSCEPVTYDPCTHLDCQACGAETTVCL